MSSGVAMLIQGMASATVMRTTTPAPDRSAARADKMAAPTIERDPATIASVPTAALWDEAVRFGKTAAQLDGRSIREGSQDEPPLRFGPSCPGLR